MYLLFGDSDFSCSLVQWGTAWGSLVAFQIERLVCVPIMEEGSLAPPVTAVSMLLSVLR